MNLPIENGDDPYSSIKLQRVVKPSTKRNFMVFERGLFSLTDRSGSLEYGQCTSLFSQKARTTVVFFFGRGYGDGDVFITNGIRLEIPDLDNISPETDP